MLGSAEELYERIAEEFTRDFEATYGPVSGGIRQFSLSPVTKARGFSQRASSLATFRAVLDSQSSVFSVGVGYNNGDYIGATSVTTEYVRERYAVPDNASYLVFYIKGGEAEPGFAASKRYEIFYDDELNELSRSAGATTKFDPRLRPWYKQAKDEPSTTRPYVFYESKIVGLTAMSKTPEPGVVVVFDITLANFEQTVSKYQITSESEVVLVDAEGQVLAYDFQNGFTSLKQSVGNVNLIDEKPLLAKLNQLNSNVLSYISENIELKEQNLEFEFDSRSWIGSVRQVAKPGGIDLFAVIFSPVDELLAEAIAIRWQLILTTLIVILFFIPIIWLISKRISNPLKLLSDEAESIARFDFSESQLKPSFIKEVDDLASMMEMMKSTINKFIKLINSLAGEKNLDNLLRDITKETRSISQADAALIYLMDEKSETLKADFLCDENNEKKILDNLLPLSMDETAILLENNAGYRSLVVEISATSQNKLTPLLKILAVDKLASIVMPLKNRNNEIIGLLCLLFENAQNDIKANNIEFVEALSGFAAVTLESRQLFNMQEALLHAFIKLIAGAIDAKSPYTGGHCARVPEITLMLAKAACVSQQGIFKDFNLNEKQWQELSVAGWLHDCGKVTTPEFVVDKATKLETIYDRIHEIRMRFEVLKRDDEIACWKKIADGGNKDDLLHDLNDKCKQIDDDFAFIAECNIGGEFMADEKIERLQKMAATTWLRTLDDNLGLSWEELNRKSEDSSSLPVTEKLLSDKPEHLIARHTNDKISQDNPWGFNIDTPEFKYNRGELYNLSIKRGTLTEEDRYMINGHMIQTIMMLNALPFPKDLRDVPLIAGSHHETMDGKGYPKKLSMNEQPLTARMMVIADIFEALTASDRPYKKAKTLSEALRILSFMRNDKHVDPDLFDLFLQSGVYLEYAKKFLAADQIDQVNIEEYLSST